MLVAIDLSAQKDYVSKFDKGEEPTVFKLGVLSSTEMQQVSNRTIKFVSGNDGETMGIDVRSGERVRFLVLLGLRGWENFKKQDGTAVEFRTRKRTIIGLAPKEIVDEVLLDLIPYAVVQELAFEIQKMNEVSETDEKN